MSAGPVGLDFSDDGSSESPSGGKARRGDRFSIG